jgi:hypothetical protein
MAMKAKHLLAALVVMGTVATTASEAQAQYYGYGYGPRPVYAVPAFNRQGLTVGFAVGGGIVKPDNVDFTGGGWVSFRIGGMLTRNFALLFDTETVFFPATLSATKESATGYSGMAGLAGQIFLDPTPLWLKAAAGFAYYGAQGDFTSIYSTIYGFGFSVGLGVDLVKFRHPFFPWAISLETQVTPMFFRADQVGNSTGKLVNWTVGVGFQWY